MSNSFDRVTHVLCVEGTKLILEVLAFFKNFQFSVPICLLLKYVNNSFRVINIIMLHEELVYVFLSPITPQSVNSGQSSFSVLVGNGRNFG